MTICTHSRRCILGDVIQGAFRPNAAGRAVKECWYELPHHYAGVGLDAFAVMPNHVHGVIGFLDPVGAGFKPALRRRTLSEVVRAFKTFSGRRINEQRGEAGVAVWQRGFYEHIVRNEKSLSEIRRYIAGNPRNWETDPENLF
ncbi:MAG TPA: transposase [Candidatus Acidoferrales bacterium]|nr:transposase [Candidatus Acidoferrales bacterium]